MEKRLDFTPRQHASPQRFVCEAVLAYHNITVLEYPPYSPDLAPCGFYLFPKTKSVLKGTHFLSVGDVKAKTTEILNSLSESDLQNCFERWQHRMQLCVNSEGNYFERVLVDFLNLLNKMRYRHSLVCSVSDLVNRKTEEFSIRTPYPHFRRVDELVCCLLNDTDAAV
jgi:hypothetical protein